MWDKLKEILKTTNEKAIIIEDGVPKYVVLSIDEYLRLSKENSSESTQSSSFPAASVQSEPLTAPIENNQKQDLEHASPSSSESIFRGSVSPDDAHVPVDLSDIDMTDSARLAGYEESSSEIRLDDLPL